MNNTDTFRALPHVAYAQIFTDSVLLDTHRGIFFELNEVATEAWLLLAHNCMTINQLRDSLLLIFNVTPDVLLQDMYELITQLLHDKLIEKTS